MTTEIAEKVAELSGGTKKAEMLLVMSEKRVAHANSSKHHKGGIGLTQDEYASISRIIASPSMVIWDKDNQNLIYLNQDKTIKVVVDAPSKDKLKPRDRVDAIINAYKVDFKKVEEAIKGGVYVILK